MIPNLPLQVQGKLTSQCNKAPNHFRELSNVAYMSLRRECLILYYLLDKSSFYSIAVHLLYSGESSISFQKMKRISIGLISSKCLELKAIACSCKKSPPSLSQQKKNDQNVKYCLALETEMLKRKLK